MYFCHFSNWQKHVVLCWQNNGRNPELFHLFYLFFHDTMHMRLSCDTMLTTTTTVASFAFLLPLRKVNISDFPYIAGQKNCNNVFRPKKVSSSLFLFIFEPRNAEISARDMILHLKTTASLRITALSDGNCCKLQNHSRSESTPKRILRA